MRPALTNLPKAPNRAANIVEKGEGKWIINGFPQLICQTPQMWNKGYIKSIYYVYIDDSMDISINKTWETTTESVQEID